MEFAMLRYKSLARFVATPENQAALIAILDLAEALRAGKPQHIPNPIFLHGPPGSGKSHLVSALAEELSRTKSGLTIQFLVASDFREPNPRNPGKKLVGNKALDLPIGLGDEARQADLLILEDLQHLPGRAVERVVQILDERLAHQRPTVVTAGAGPRHLGYRGVRFPARFTSRLAAGLVIALEPLQAPGRLLLLEDLAQRRQLAVPRDILEWLAQNLTGGGRQLEGAIAQLENLNKIGRRPLDLKTAAAHFRTQVDASQPTVERIASQVGGYFRIEPRHLQSRRRHHNILLPRQVGMYLARQLTLLSLEKIGAYFGGRDHTTVLHACRKVEQAMENDAHLSGTVRQLHTELA